MPCTCEVTVHSTYPEADAANAAVPIGAGWLVQVMPASDQAAASRDASSVRPILEEDAYSRSLASVTWHPDGTAGNEKRTTERALAPLLLSTFTIESLP